MPIKGQSPKQIVHTEMHKFKHGTLHSGSKHGPLVKSRKQAIAIALSESGQSKKRAAGGAAMHIVRKYAKRASGGKVKKYADAGAVDDDKTPEAPPKRLIMNMTPSEGEPKLVAPPISGPEGDIPYTEQNLPPKPEPTSLSAHYGFLPRLEDWEKSMQEQAEMSAGLYQSGAAGLQSGDPSKMALGAGQELLGAAMPAVAPVVAGYKALQNAAGRTGPGLEHAADVASWFSPGDLAKPFAAMAPMAAAAKKAPKTVSFDAIWGAASLPKAEMMEKYGKATTEGYLKDLKAPYPMDLAKSAISNNLQPWQVNNLQSYLSPGAQKAFLKHYNYLNKQNQKPWLDPAVQATKPVVQVEHDYGKEIEDLLHEYHQSKQNDVAPHYENTQNNTDKDMEEYYQYLEEQKAHEQALSEGHEGGFDEHYSQLIEDPTVPTNELHPTLSPPDLEEKAARIGLPDTAFHYTPANFSEFQLADDTGRTPDIGIHLGTLRAAVDRAVAMTGGNEQMARNIEKSYKQNIGITPQGSGLWLKSEALPHSDWKILPAKIGIGTPLVLKDLGTWGPGSIAHALANHPDFTKGEVMSALGKFDPEVSHWENHNRQHVTPALQGLRRLMESKGYDSIAYRNSVEDPGSLSYIIWNLNKARSFYAKFDPAKTESKNLGAAIAGLSLVPLSLYGGMDRAEASEKKAKGGKVTKKDDDPKDHEFINFAKGGLIDSDIPGRTDKIPMKVATGAYVLPADIPSALGQGNTMAGSQILKKMFTHSAYGLDPMKTKAQKFHFDRFPHLARGGKAAAEKALPEHHQLGMKVPKGGSMCTNCQYLVGKDSCGNKGFVEWNGGEKLPEPANEYCCDLYEHHSPEEKADGGATDHVPIIAAGGEYIIHPDVVKAVGHGDMAAGHKVLDKFVLHTRKEHIKTLKKLKPPK